MLNIISTSQAQALDPVCASMQYGQVSAILPAVTGMVVNYCRQTFAAERYPAEQYDRIPRVWLALQHAPLVQLNTVTISPDVNPTVYQASSFDIRVKDARINFKPNTVGVFNGNQWLMDGYGSPLNNTEVDYVGGMGFITTLTADIAAGTDVVLPLTAIRGYTPYLGPWSINTGDMLHLDSGNAASEEVTVSVTGATVTALSVAVAHLSGAYVCGASAPPAVQLAAAKLCGNILVMPDLTRQMEALGRTSGYWAQARALPQGLHMTPEIKMMLAPYRDTYIPE